MNTCILTTAVFEHSCGCCGKSQKSLPRSLSEAPPPKSNRENIARQHTEENRNVMSGKFS